jgi:hypothetical protein
VEGREAARGRVGGTATATLRLFGQLAHPDHFFRQRGRDHPVEVHIFLADHPCLVGEHRPRLGPVMRRPGQAPRADRPSLRRRRYLIVSLEANFSPKGEAPGLP